MKTTIFTTSLLALLLTFAVGCGQNQIAVSNSTNTVAATNENQTASATPTKPQLDDKTRQALMDALADERRAQAVYEAVLAKFGDVRPFSNIVNAEKRHESFLLPLFEKYGVKIPQNEFSKEKAEVPETFVEACKQGVEGEQANIVMYDKFLEFVKEEDVRRAFTYLRDASKDNHLPAFERCAQGRGRGIENGRGKGRQF